MRICLSPFPNRIELRRRGDAGDPGSGNEILHAQTAHEAYSLLHRHCRDPSALAQLGQAAGLAGRAGQDEVLRAIAAGVAAGRFVLVTLPRTGGGGSAGGGDAATPAPAAAAPTRPAVREEAPLPPPSRRPAPSTPEPEPNDMQDVAQDVQAEALEKAAQDGTAFCEVCEKARLAREAEQGEAA